MASTNPNSQDLGYVICDLLPLNYAEPDDPNLDESISSPCTPFFLHIFAHFTLSDVQTLQESYHVVTFSRPFSLPLAALMDDVEASRLIAWRLSDMRITPENSMVKEILDLCRKYASQKLMRLRVDVTAVVDEFPLPPEDDCQDPYSVEEVRLRHMVTTKRLIIDGDNLGQTPTCSICFEDFLVGYEATRLPCSHLYHGNCILKWLRTSKICPLCRFEMPC